MRGLPIPKPYKPFTIGFKDQGLGIGASGLGCAFFL